MIIIYTTRVIQKVVQLRQHNDKIDKSFSNQMLECSKSFSLYQQKNISNLDKKSINRNC